MPIFWLGLKKQQIKKQQIQSLYAVFFAAIAIGLWSGSLAAMAIYLLIVALPAYLISFLALLRLTNSYVSIWFPVTAIFANLMSVASIGLLALILYYSGVDGGFPGMIKSYVKQAAAALQEAGIDEQAEANIIQSIEILSVLLCSIGIWIWGFCLYLHGWIINRQLRSWNKAVREDFSVNMLPPPLWLIVFIVIAALASLFGSYSLAFWGKCSLIILLFPYFLFGMSWLHINSRNMEYRAILLFLFYFTLLALLWPAFAVAIAGLFHHIRILSKVVK